MTPDFTLKLYKRLLNTLSYQGFSFLPFSHYVSNPKGKVIVLRHDVDALPENSLEFARIQANMGIKGSYYFRIVPVCFDIKIIKEINSLGHEVGYHYEDLGTTALLYKGVTAEEELVELAKKSFEENLERLRQIVPVKTICMHGSPMSKWDNRLLWKYYDYHDFGITGEPYFDIDFKEVLYVTDTGRRWDGSNVSVRDKTRGPAYAKTSADKVKLSAQGKNPFEHWKVKPKISTREPFHRFHSTLDIIRAAEAEKLPDKIMMTFHPQRWTDDIVPWMKELLLQNIKNAGKYFFVIIRQ
jgi:hypothetical protein